MGEELDPLTQPHPCYRCGGKHAADKCRFKESDCHYCKKKGCRLRDSTAQNKPTASKQSQDTHHIETERAGDDTYNLFAIDDKSAPPPVMVTLEINQKKLSMEVDTGASVSLINHAMYTNLWAESHRPKLQPSTRKLRTYTGEELEVHGCLTVDVQYKKQQQTLPLLVVAGKGPSLLGRDWLQKIVLDWRSLHHLQAAPPTKLQAILDSRSDVFKDELGCIKGLKAIDAEATPHFCKP